MELAVRNYKRDEEILCLRNMKGWTFAQIGKKYDITKGRVRHIYYRIVEEKRKEAESNLRMGIGA